VCGYVDHMDLAEIAEGLEVDHVDVRREGRADAVVDVRREDHVDAAVDHVDVQIEARVRGEDLVPAAVVC